MQQLFSDSLLFHSSCMPKQPAREISLSVSDGRYVGFSPQHDVHLCSLVVPAASPFWECNVQLKESAADAVTEL